MELYTWAAAVREGRFREVVRLGMLDAGMPCHAWEMGPSGAGEGWVGLEFFVLLGLGGWGKRRAEAQGRSLGFVFAFLFWFSWWVLRS